ncbi:MAG: hypothetical protein MHPSP_003548, partial [Paramarteilia canceri]
KFQKNSSIQEISEALSRPEDFVLSQNLDKYYLTIDLNIVNTRFSKDYSFYLQLVVNKTGISVPKYVKWSQNSMNFECQLQINFNQLFNSIYATEEIVLHIILVR